MTISVPTADEVDRYGWLPDEDGGRGAAMPRIADGEAVCPVFQVESGVAGYWARGDVDVHVLHAKQHAYTRAITLGAATLDAIGGVGEGAWLGRALRERREHRWRLLRAGLRTSASGLMVLNPRAQLVLPGGPSRG